MSPKIVFIGAGNLATQLSKAIQNSGFEILQVYSRSNQSASILAKELSISYTIDLAQIEKNADIYIVALKDSVFDEVLSKIDFGNKLVIHCSGSLPLSILKKYSENIGVFYPLQTFSKNRNVDFSEIPVFLESDKSENIEILKLIAKKVSRKVEEMGSERRKILHVSAVFACNFSNYMYSVASDILNSKEIPFEVLKPLILETAQKVQEMDPKTAQTGPAVRFDKNIINKHLDELKNSEVHYELYKSISKRIFEHHKK